MFLFSALEQFAIKTYFYGSVTIEMVAVTFIFVFFYLYYCVINQKTTAEGFAAIPNYWQALLEIVQSLIVALVKDNVKDVTAAKFFPLVFTIFLFYICFYSNSYYSSHIFCDSVVTSPALTVMDSQKRVAYAFTSFIWLFIITRLVFWVHKPVSFPWAGALLTKRFNLLTILFFKPLIVPIVRLFEDTVAGELFVNKLFFYWRRVCIPLMRYSFFAVGLVLLSSAISGIDIIDSVISFFFGQSSQPFDPLDPPADLDLVPSDLPETEDEPKTKKKENNSLLLVGSLYAIGCIVVIVLESMR